MNSRIRTGGIATRAAGLRSPKPTMTVAAATLPAQTRTVIRALSMSTRRSRRPCAIATAALVHSQLVALKQVTAKSSTTASPGRETPGAQLAVPPTTRAATDEDTTNAEALWMDFRAPRPHATCRTSSPGPESRTNHGAPAIENPTTSAASP